MVRNLVHNLYKSLVTDIGAVSEMGGKASPPIPITYLTQWKIVGNSEVHTDPYLTSWKVSGNSVVDNNTILSCGDLGQDGKYHVKISNGVTIYDIPLTEPLRKVNDVADTIEFPSSTEGKALVTRILGSVDLGKTRPTSMTTSTSGYNRWRLNDVPINMKRAPSSNEAANTLCATFAAINPRATYNIPANPSISVSTSDNVFILYSDSLAQLSADEVKAALDGVIIIVELATPTTELVDAPQIVVSPTDTYTSANVTPYSAFEHTENKEIWSCGEYNATDGKYHILVQPLGGSIADIALTEPLRKVNDITDTIEFPSGTEGKALVTRNFTEISLSAQTWRKSGTITTDVCRWFCSPAGCYIYDVTVIADILCSGYDVKTANQTNAKQTGISMNNSRLTIYDPDYNNENDNKAFVASLNGKVCIYRLATPTTELADAPQIQEADSYTCVITPGGKAVSWSSFETN